jgi:TolB-like protein
LSLWSEIKQRRITQIVIAYLVGGWIAVSVVDQVVDREVLPLVAYQVVFTLFLFGILGALIVGWYHGEKGEQKAPPIEIAMLTVIGLLAVGTSVQVARTSLAQASLEDAINPDNLRRIAVLYLDDLSRDGSMQPVADGITEGLISALGSVRELDVRSRNASIEARALGDVPIDSVAGILGVGALVDGTVDQSGDELRISIRLLEGQTGAPLFRETFEWPADQVATVGTELATEVANALRARIGGEIRLREGEASAPNAAAWLQVARAERYLKDASDAILARDVDGIVEALDAAEAELVAAQASAPEWPEPLVLRSQVAYEWYILAGSIDELVESMDMAIEHANAALRLDPSNPAALEWRGTARYRKWLSLLGQPGTGEDMDALLASAQADLERSETIDPDRASALSTLSHLYYQVDDVVNAVVAARTAYEQDAFLDVADEVLWRLYTAAYDQDQARDAERWCAEGGTRFPDDFRFVQCRLFLMTMPGAAPDPDRAWELHDALLPLLTERTEFFDAQARVLVAGVLGRAGMADSANVVFEGARLSEELDPEREIAVMEGAMRSMMGDVDGSIAALQRWVLANPDQAIGEHWWWRNVTGNPAFERLRGQH